MAAQPVRDEYLEVDGVPLDTAAWEVTDLSPLWDLPDVRGDDAVVPYRRGVVPFRRSWGGKRVDLPFNLYGSHDSEGNPATDLRAQLWVNRSELIRDVLRPLQVGTATGDRLIRYHAPDGSQISGPGKLIGGLRPQPAGPTALRGSLTLILTEGGLRDETEVDVTSDEVEASGSDDFTVPNPGEDYQDVLRLDLTGTATSVTLTNLTADAAGDVFWEFGGPFDAGVAVDTGNFSAVRDSVSVVGLVTFGGFERWLPLVPGDNVVRIEPLGGTVTVRFRHFPFHP
jgi:hypothetical protein